MARLASAAWLRAVVVGVFGVAVGVAADATSLSYMGICSAPWMECHRYDASKPATPPEQEFREHVLEGMAVRATLRKAGYMEAFNLDNINMNHGVICGESQERITSPITASADWLPMLVCTDGHVSFLNVSAHSRGGLPQDTPWTLDSISFRTRATHPAGRPLVSHYLDGTATRETADAIVPEAFHAEVRGVMLDRGYAFMMENTHHDVRTGHVSGQSLSHISQAYTNTESIEFRKDPYYWYSSWETSGRRDSARFTVGSLDPLRHTNDLVALQWFADVCWQAVYVHDGQGGRVAGSLDLLKAHVRMGHRVRVAFNGLSLEAAAVWITPQGSVLAQTTGEMARRGGDKADRTFFNTKTRRVHRLVHNTGVVQSLWFFIQTGELSQESTDNFQVTWSVDTRPWNPVLTMHREGLKFGSRAALVEAAAADNARVGVTLEEKAGKGWPARTELYLAVSTVRCDNVAAEAAPLVAQALRTTPIKLHGSGPEYRMALYRPVNRYIEVYSTGKVRASTFLMSSLAFVAAEELPVVDVTWFTDGAVKAKA